MTYIKYHIYNIYTNLHVALDNEVVQRRDLGRVREGKVKKKMREQGQAK